MPNSIVSGMVHSDTICKIFWAIYYINRLSKAGKKENQAKLFSPQCQFFVCQSSKRELLGGDFFNRAWLPWVSTTNRQQWWNRHFIELLDLWPNEIFLFSALFLIWIHISLYFWQVVMITTLYHLYPNFLESWYRSGCYLHSLQSSYFHDSSAAKVQFAMGKEVVLANKKCYCVSLSRNQELSPLLRSSSAPILIIDVVSLDTFSSKRFGKVDIKPPG